MTGTSAAPRSSDAATDPAGPTGRLATWLAGTTLPDVPAPVREHAKHLILDGMACALVFTLMVGPAAAAGRWTTHLGRGVALAAALALAEAWAGIALAYHTDWPTSFWITALSAGVYFASLVPLRKMRLA